MIEFLEQWLGTIRESVRPKTLHQYTQIVRGHIAPLLGEIKLKELRPDQIQNLYNLKMDKGISARTVLLIHAVLHRSLNHALRLGIVNRNPVDAVQRPKFKKKEMKILNESQTRAFLSAVKGDRCEALYWLAVSTGMRQGELLGLKWSDVDWRNKRVYIQRQLQRLPEQHLAFTEPKSAAGKRVIVLSTTLIEKLKDHIALQDQEIHRAGVRWQENDLIFPSVIGTPLDHRNLFRDFKIILNSAGLPDIRFHDLRHTAATLMLLQGIHPKVVQERLGHSDISLTLNTYSHVLPSMQEEAAEKMDEILKPINVSEELKQISEFSTNYKVSK